MSLTLINTPAATNANSYVSLATAGLYIEENLHIYATWASLSTANREASLIYATSLLDTQIDWIGTKGDSSQALRWPRDDAVDQDGYDVTSTGIPIPVQRATAFYAYFLSQSDRVAEVDTFGFKRLKAGSLEMEIDKYDRRETMPTIVWDLIKGYGTRSRSQSRVLERR